MLFFPIRLRREPNAMETRDPRAAATRRIKKWLESGGRIEMGHFTEYARAVELRPEPAVASKLAQIWNEVGRKQGMLLVAMAAVAAGVEI